MSARSVATDAAADEEQRFSLTLPPSSAYVGTARLFAGAVARHFGADEDSVEELKLAVSEACTGAIRAQGESATAPVRMEILRGADRLAFEVGASGVTLPWSAGEVEDAAARTPTTDYMTSLSVQMIQGLFGDVAIVESPDGGTSIRFSVPLRHPE